VQRQPELHHLCFRMAAGRVWGFVRSQNEWRRSSMLIQRILLPAKGPSSLDATTYGSQSRGLRHILVA